MARKCDTTETANVTKLSVRSTFFSSYIISKYDKTEIATVTSLTVLSTCNSSYIVSKYDTREIDHIHARIQKVLSEGVQL